MNVIYEESINILVDYDSHVISSYKNDSQNKEQNAIIKILFKGLAVSSNDRIFNDIFNCWAILKPCDLKKEYSYKRHKV